MEQQVIDIHCHPALKTWLFPSHHVYDTEMPRGWEFSENCFVNIVNMQTGNVGMAVSVYYLPEKQIETLPIRNIIDKVLLAVLETVCVRLPEIIENTDTPTGPFEQIKQYIAMFEADIEFAQNQNVAIAYSYTDILNLTMAGKTVFLHSIEGAHALGCAPIDQDTLLSNLEWLFDAGICQITLGHFFENILVSTSGGIPPGLASQIGYDPKAVNTYPLGYNGDMAIAAIDRMLELGIIIDLGHCHPLAKAMVIERNNLRGTNKRPLTFAHTGVREVALRHHPDMLPDYAAYLPDSTDITSIKDCNGVLGVIFMDYWLTGDDNFQPAIAAVVETIVFIRDVPDSNGNSGTYDHIAIGSDLDGFTTVPQDLGGDRMMKDLINAIAAIPGITADDVDKIGWTNYMRVLKNGWGKA